MVTVCLCIIDYVGLRLVLLIIVCFRFCGCLFVVRLLICGLLVIAAYSLLVCCLLLLGCFGLLLAWCLCLCWVVLCMFACFWYLCVSRFV